MYPMQFHPQKSQLLRELLGPEVICIARRTFGRTLILTDDNWSWAELYGQRSPRMQRIFAYLTSIYIIITSTDEHYYRMWDTEE